MAGGCEAEGRRGREGGGLPWLRRHASERARRRDHQGSVHGSRWGQGLDSVPRSAGTPRRIRLEDSAGVPIKSPGGNGATTEARQKGDCYGSQPSGTGERDFYTGQSGKGG